MYFINKNNQAVTLPTTGVTVTDDSADATNPMFFPFHADGTNKDCLLEVRNSSGNLVWQEYVAGATVTQGWHAFRIDISGAHASANCVVKSNLTTAAETYSFTVSYGGTVVSSGSFTYTV